MPGKLSEKTHGEKVIMLLDELYFSGQPILNHEEML